MGDTVIVRIITFARRAPAIPDLLALIANVAALVNRHAAAPPLILRGRRAVLAVDGRHKNRLRCIKAFVHMRARVALLLSVYLEVARAAPE